MFYSRVFARISRNGLNHCRGVLSSRPQLVSSFYNNSHDLREPSIKAMSLHHPLLDMVGSRGYWFSSSASPEPSEKVTNQPGNRQETSGENNTSTNNETRKTNGDGKAAESKEDAGSASKPKPEAEEKIEDSDTEGDLTTDDLVKLVAEKEELLKMKHKEIEKMQDKVLRSYAEMENVMDRTRREAENSKKFAIQNFAKSLLDVADNLVRASSVVKDSFSKVDSSKDASGAVPLLKTLLEGVEMTEKQLSEVFKKFGVEKYDPQNEPFDPHRHNAVFQLPDGSKPPGTVAVVLKSGYTLYDRVIRPAEVGVTREVSDEADQGSEA